MLMESWGIFSYYFYLKRLCDRQFFLLSSLEVSFISFPRRFRIFFLVCDDTVAGSIGRLHKMVSVTRENIRELLPEIEDSITRACFVGECSIVWKINSQFVRFLTVLRIQPSIRSFPDWIWAKRSRGSHALIRRKNVMHDCERMSGKPRCCSSVRSVSFSLFELQWNVYFFEKTIFRRNFVFFSAWSGFDRGSG